MAERTLADENSIHEYDIAIVGGGPGGTTCALRLADSGLKVVLLEKEQFPRDKICGDALSGKVVSTLKYVQPELVPSLYDFSEKLGSWGIRFFAPNGQALDVPFKRERDTASQNAPGFISKRLDFDHFLWREVEKRQHCTLIQNQRLQQATSSPDGIVLKTADHHIKAKLAIGADGAHSILAKELQGARKIEKAHHSGGIRAYFKGVTDFHDENFIELHYLKDLLPGYFWIFPLPNGWANVGLGMLTKDLSRLKVNLRQRLDQIIAEHPLIAPRFEQAEQIGKTMGFGLPLGSKKRIISGDHFMLVGDAASLIDPFTGEGIGNAMLSGKIAAEKAMLAFERQDFSAKALADYDVAVWKKMGRELQLSHQMQKLVNYPWLFNFVVRKANKNQSIQTMLTMMFESLDIRKELKKPSFYWRLLRN
ncbi:MAG: geranylgeranyl reductase family protein [Bacteroidota bacterium]